MVEKRTLEARIAAALNDEIKTSAAVSDLIAEVETAAINAEQQAVEACAKALDPAITVDAAAVSAAVVAAELTRDRLTGARPRLLERLSQCLAAEAKADWDASYTELEPRFDAVVQRFNHSEALAEEMVAIFSEALQIEAEADRLNMAAQPGESRRLRFSTSAKAILAKVVLIGRDGEQMWPIKRNGSIGTMMFAPPVQDDSTTGDWWKVGAEQARIEAERAQQQLEADEAARIEFYKGR